MGPASIEGYYDEALAVPGLLVEIARGRGGGRRRRTSSPASTTPASTRRARSPTIPVIGICEAALSRRPRFIAQRFTVVTTLARSIPVPIEALVARYGMAGALRRVRAADVAVLDLEDPASGARDRSCGARSRDALGDDRAEAIVLGCAGMADLASASRGGSACRSSTASRRR